MDERNKGKNIGLFGKVAENLDGAISAAYQGDPIAQYNLRVPYFNSSGVKKNLIELAHLYRLAAEQGDASAQTNLGICYAQGQGVDQDFNAAVRLFKLAPDQDFASAQFNLGACYVKGQIAKDYELDFKCFKNAANNGYKQEEKAIEQLKKRNKKLSDSNLSAQTNVEIQYDLGRSYQKGNGVTKDPKEEVRINVRYENSLWVKKKPAQNKSQTLPINNDDKARTINTNSYWRKKVRTPSSSHSTNAGSDAPTQGDPTLKIKDGLES